MIERKIYKAISKIEGVSEFVKRDDRLIAELAFHEFNFEFAGMKFAGSQVESPLFTLNRLNLLFGYTLKKDTTKLNILEAINQYNINRPLLKITLTKLQGKKLNIVFSSDFIGNDNDISENQLEALVKILSPTPMDFGNYLNHKKILLSQG